jgi:hypothetical protein
MSFEQRTIEPVPGRRMQIDLLVPPDLRSIDLQHAPGPRSREMLERAHAALATWRPGAEQLDEARARVRRSRELRRGEQGGDADGPLLERAASERPSGEDVDRVVDAERLAVELAAAPPITLDGIGRLHAAVVGAARPLPWRTEVTWMGDRSGPNTEQRFQPAAPERVPGAMEELERFLARDGDPVLRAAVVFAQLPIIHPWHDGNGRTGRVLADAALAAGLPHGGRGPRVSDQLASLFHAAVVGLDAWRVDGDLDSWVAMFAGATVQATTIRSASRRGLLRKRR